MTKDQLKTLLTIQFNIDASKTKITIETEDLLHIMQTMYNRGQNKGVIKTIYREPKQ